MKTCKKCQETKDESKFRIIIGHYKDKTYKNIQSICNACCQLKTAEWKKNNPSFVKRYNKIYQIYLSDKGRKIKLDNAIKWQQLNWERKKEIEKNCKLKNPHLQEAANKLRAAIRSGEIVRQPCATCGTEKSIAKHLSYGEELDFIWSCRKCEGIKKRAINKQKYLESLNGKS